MVPGHAWLVLGLLIAGSSLAFVFRALGSARSLADDKIDDAIAANRFKPCIDSTTGLPMVATDHAKLARLGAKTWQRTLRAQRKLITEEPKLYCIKSKTG